MPLWKTLRRPPWRTLILLLAILGIGGLGYLAWSPGERVTDGRHDRGTNGIWLQHGWLGDDAWFERHERDPAKFRSTEKVAALRELLASHGIRDVFPHLCPCTDDGRIAAVDPVQTDRFLDHMDGFRVMPWIGGVWQESALPMDVKWRARFVESATGLLTAHPRLAGLHLNIEPLPDGDPDFLLLLDEMKAALPSGKLLSLAAYPPPTRWHPYPDVHWSEPYFREVARRCDQLVPMLYDTGLRWEKPYRQLMADWTREVLAWSEGKEVLLGVPAYDDAGTGYHDPAVENLPNAFSGIHAALGKSPLPAHYGGIAIYAEWEMDPTDWRVLREALPPLALISQRRPEWLLSRAISRTGDFKSCVSRPASGSSATFQVASGCVPPRRTASPRQSSAATDFTAIGAKSHCPPLSRQSTPPKASNLAWLPRA